MRIIVFSIAFLCTSFAVAQNSQELDERNGFMDIKLLSIATEYENLEYWKVQKKEEDHAIYRTKRGTYKSVGDVPIHKITVRTYRDIIYEIEVISNEDEQFFRSLEKAYGKIKYSVGSQISYWEGEDVKLTYLPDGKKIKLTYSAKGINQIIASDKKKAVDSLATEF